jgi:hypothetical protein
MSEKYEANIIQYTKDRLYQSSRTYNNPFESVLISLHLFM